MLGIGWTEIFLIAVIAVLAVGPKDIPQALYTLGRVVRRLQYAQFALTRQFEEFMRIHDLDELRKGVNFEAPQFNPASGAQIPDPLIPDPDEALADADYLSPDDHDTNEQNDDSHAASPAAAKSE